MTPQFLRNLNSYAFFSFTLSDIIQILLSLCGFIFAVCEIRKTQNAVEASKIATKKKQ